MPRATSRSSAKQSPWSVASESGKHRGTEKSRRAGVRALALTLAALLLALTGCVTPTVLREPSVRDRLQEFLNERVGRLSTGDVDGFLAASSPQAREFEQAIALGTLAVPLTGLSMTVDNSLPERGSPLGGLEVTLTYRYNGLPADNVFRVLLEYDFTDTEGVWTVARAGLKPGAALPVWAAGPIASRESQHFLLLHRPALSNPDRVLREAEEARAQLDGKITFPLEDRYLIIAAEDDEEYQTMSSATLGSVSAIAQVETSYEVTPDTVRVLSRQMVVNTRKLHQDGEALETLRHELGHLAVAQYTRPFTPAWVSESAAMFLAGTRPVSIWRNGLNRNRFETITIERLTRASNLGVHDPTQEGASLEYAYSAAAAWYLVDAFGADRYWDFYRSYAEVPAQELYDRLPETATGSSGDSLEALAVDSTGAALQEHFALDPARLDLAILEWMRSQVA